MLDKGETLCQYWTEEDIAELGFDAPGSINKPDTKQSGTWATGTQA